MPSELLHKFSFPASAHPPRREIAKDAEEKFDLGGVRMGAVLADKLQFISAIARGLDSLGIDGTMLQLSRAHGSGYDHIMGIRAWISDLPGAIERLLLLNWAIFDRIPLIIFIKMSPSPLVRCISDSADNPRLAATIQTSKAFFFDMTTSGTHPTGMKATFGARRKVARQYCAKIFPPLDEVPPPLSPRPKSIAPKVCSKKIGIAFILPDL